MPFIIIRYRKVIYVANRVYLTTNYRVLENGGKHKGANSTVMSGRAPSQCCNHDTRPFTWL